MAILVNNSASSHDVFSWPEFKALARRLGIPDVYTTKLEILLEMDEVVHIRHEFIATLPKNPDVGEVLVQ